MELHNGSVSAHLKRLERLKWGKAKPKPKRAKPSPDDATEAALNHELGYLVGIYERIRRQNQLSMGGVNPITFTEIKAFDDLAKTEIDPFDLDTLEKLDAVWRNCLPKRSQP